MKNIPSLEEQQASVPFVESSDFREAFHAERKPDFGEPWRATDHHFITTEGNFSTGVLASLHRNRIAACVSACAGMQDPAAEIQALRAELQKTRKILADANRGAERNSHINNSLAGKLNAARDENEAMRAAIGESHTALGGCLKYILRLPMSGSDSECETMDDAHHALRKLKPFLP